jgi:hypothetical protein
LTLPRLTPTSTSALEHLDPESLHIKRWGTPADFDLKLFKALLTEAQMID